MSTFNEYLKKTKKYAIIFITKNKAIDKNLFLSLQEAQKLCEKEKMEALLFNKYEDYEKDLTSIYKIKKNGDFIIS